MTTITVFKESGLIIGYHASGHSEYAASGEDIVCAAASIITQSTLLGLQEVAKVKITASKDDDKALLEVKLHEQNDQAQTILKTMELALKNLQEQYPKYVQVKEEAK